MQNWLRRKLDHITQEFLAGEGYGGVFEAQYLAYLECLVAHWQGVLATPGVWVAWHEVCAKATPKGEKVTCLSNRIADRAELVRALNQFRRRYTGPTRRFRAQPAPEVRSTEEGIDLFDLISGD